MTPTIALTGAGFVDDLTTMGAGFALLATGAGPNPVATNCGGGTVTANPGATSFSLAGATADRGQRLHRRGQRGDAGGDRHVHQPHHRRQHHDRARSHHQRRDREPDAGLDIGDREQIVQSDHGRGRRAELLDAFDPDSQQQCRSDRADRRRPHRHLPHRHGHLHDTDCELHRSRLQWRDDHRTRGRTQISIVGANVNANSICTLSVRVVANIAGNLIDTVPAAAITSAQGVTNLLQGTATLAATGTVNLTISKTDGVAAIVPGGTTTYTIGVSNAGPGDVTGLGVNDTPPAGMTFHFMDMRGERRIGVSCERQRADRRQRDGSSRRLGHFHGQRGDRAGRHRQITNTASLAVPGAVINTNPVTSANDTDTLTPQADLAITKTDNVASVVPGTSTGYTIVATNAGRAMSWAPWCPIRCRQRSPGRLGPVWHRRAAAVQPRVRAASMSRLDLLAGGSATFTSSATISTTATGTLTNTASVAVPAGVTDPNPNNNSATDTDTLTPQADLAITKTDGVGSVAAGGSTTYTIVATQQRTECGHRRDDDRQCAFGPHARRPGAAAPPRGRAAPPLGAATSRPPSICSSAVARRSSSTARSAERRRDHRQHCDHRGAAGRIRPDTRQQRRDRHRHDHAGADLSITKTDGTASCHPGASTTYTVVVRNNGPSGVVGAVVSDTLPAAVTSAAFTAVGSGGASGFSASGSGNIGDTRRSPRERHRDVHDRRRHCLGRVRNAGKHGDGHSPLRRDRRQSRQQQRHRHRYPDSSGGLTVVKTDGSASYTPGGTATYTLVTRHRRRERRHRRAVTDLLPPGLTLTSGASCVANGVATCGTVTGGVGQTSFSDDRCAHRCRHG